MVRTFWENKVHSAWQEKSIIWLTGVRRVGKTTLCRGLTPEAYFDCELPRVRKLLTDPEVFFSGFHGERLTLDEIHRLENASEVLKIAADHFPNIKILATGSSVLGASRRFRDTLTGRKRTVFITPLNHQDLRDFIRPDLIHRGLYGGLPSFFLSDPFPENDFQEWLDSFWAKDIEELFNLEKKHAFLKFFELLALQSGGLFEAKSFAAPCGVSHTTIASYLNVLEQTHVAYVLRPFHKNAAKEIISAPKVYFFDTGFISFFHGVTQLHPNERGKYWEHLVLNELLSFVERESIHIWRDKSKNEIDFIIKLRGKSPIAIECKWDVSEFSPKCLRKFRELHPKGRNYLVAPEIRSKRPLFFQDLEVHPMELGQLRDVIHDAL